MLLWLRIKTDQVIYFKYIAWSLNKVYELLSERNFKIGTMFKLRMVICAKNDNTTLLRNKCEEFVASQTAHWTLSKLELEFIYFSFLNMRPIYVHMHYLTL